MYLLFNKLIYHLVCGRGGIGGRGGTGGRGGVSSFTPVSMELCTPLQQVQFVPKTSNLKNKMAHRTNLMNQAKSVMFI